MNRNSRQKHQRFIIFMLLIIVVLTGNAIYASEGSTRGYDFISPSYQQLRRVGVEATLGTGYAYVQGYIDEEGREVIPIIYEDAVDFSYGPTALVKENGQYKQIDREGSVVFEYDSSFERIAFFNGINGMAAKEDGKYAVIDSKGNAITDFLYNHVGRFTLNESFFVVSEASQSGNSNQLILWGLMSGDGKPVTEQIYREFVSGGDFMPAPMVIGAAKEVNGELLYGFLDRNGQEKDFIYESMTQFWNGIAGVQKDGKWALVNINGTQITGFLYDSLSPFEDGVGFVYIGEEKSFIDTQGNSVPAGKNPLMESHSVHIYINDNWLYTDQEPLIIEDRTMVPIRALAEAFDYVVDWNDKDQSIVLQNQTKILRLSIGSNQAVINTFDDGAAAETITLDVVPQIINGRTLIPLRFVAENFDAKVDWRDRSVYIVYQ